MGTLTFRIVNPGDPPFADQSMLDTCVDPQFNGVFPDDPSLGIVSERKANGELFKEPARIFRGIGQRLPSQDT